MHDLNEESALRFIMQGTASETGERFFRALAKNLAEALGTYGAMVTEFVPEENCLRALSFWVDGEFIDDYTYDVAGTPCEISIRDRSLVHYEHSMANLFPFDQETKRMAW